VDGADEPDEVDVAGAVDEADRPDEVDEAGEIDEADGISVPNMTPETDKQ